MCVDGVQLIMRGDVLCFFQVGESVCVLRNEEGVSVRLSHCSHTLGERGGTRTKTIRKSNLLSRMDTCELELSIV